MSSVLLLAMQATIAIPFAYFTLFSTFQSWDDEGTIMRWDRHLLEGHALYDQVWNIYGPVPYLFRYVLHAVGIPLSHDAYRFTTLGLWLAATMLYSLSTYRMTRSLPAAALAHLVALGSLASIANEPGHAQGYAAVVLGAVLLLSTAATTAPRLACAALGATVAVMVLTKVNAGLFLAMALAMALVALTPATRTGVAARLAVGAGLLALVPSIVSSMASSSGWWDFGIAATTGHVLIYLTALRWGRPEISWRECFWALTGTVLAAALITGLTNALLGSSLHALLNSVFIQSFKHPVWLSHPGLGVSQIATLGGVLACIVISAARQASGRWSKVIAAGFQAVFGLAILAEISGGWSRSPVSAAYATLLSWTLPFLWLTVMTSDEEREAITLLPRFALASCAGLQALYVFPYGGSQLAFATVLICLCGVVCLHDGLRGLVALLPGRSTAVWLRRAGAAAVALWLVAAYARSARHAHASWTRGIPLNLPGAQLIRLPEIRVAGFRWLAYNLSANCDTFLGAPPFESMYMWTGKPAPTTLGGRWFLTFDDGQQRGIIDDFARYQRRCVIRNERAMDYWLRFRSRSEAGQGSSLPLFTYLTEDFVPIGRVQAVDAWRFLIDKKRPLPEPTYSARLVKPSGTASSLGRASRISLRLPASDGPPVTRFQIYDPLQASVLADSVPQWDAALLRVFLASTTVQSGASQALQEPLDRAIPHHLTLITPIETIAPFALVRLYDAVGLLVESVPFVGS